MVVPWLSKYLNQYCFDFRSLDLSQNVLFITCWNFPIDINGMQDSSISILTKNWSSRIYLISAEKMGGGGGGGGDES